MNKIVFLLFVLITLGLSFSQDQELDSLLSFDLEELMNIKVVSASRSEHSLKDLPMTVHIITREEILNNSYSSLVDVLKDIPGIKVSQPGNGTHGEKYLMRGLFGNNYAKILINGIPIRPSSVDGMPIGEQINMRNVERIEVVYGPASALYGADALSGIINIVTCNPETDTTLVELLFGTKGYASTKFFMNHHKKDWTVNVYGGYIQRKDLNIPTDTNAFSHLTLFGDTVTVGKLPNESHNVGVEVLYKDFHFSFDHMYRTDHSSLEQDSRYYILDNPDLKYGEKIQRASLKHSLEAEKLKFNTALSYLRYRLDNESAFGMIFYATPLYKYMASDDILLEETVIYNINDKLEFVGGLSGQYSGAMPKTNDLTKPFDEDLYKPFSDDIPSQGAYQSPLLGDFGFNPLTYYNIAGFLQGTYVTKLYTLMAGLRYDYHSEYENKVTPRIAGLINITEKTSARMSYNQAYRAPPPYKVYNSIAIDNGDSTILYLNVPNEDLQPEKFSAFEGGVRHRFNDRISVELVGYYNKISGLMSSQGIKLDSLKYPYASSDSANADRNSPDAESVLRGVDFIVTVKDIHEPTRSNASFYLSYADGKETLPNGENIDIFRNVPEVLAKLRFNTTFFNSFYIGMDNIYCSKWYARVWEKAQLDIPNRKSKSYFTTDILTKFTVPLKHHNCMVLFRIDNLFDEEYGGYKYRDGAQYGRCFYGGIEYGF
jgi:hemoglobin/transferrin/lactoferrin receptor protein